jgi:hypothetical protein
MLYHYISLEVLLEEVILILRESDNEVRVPYLFSFLGLRVPRLNSCGYQ